MSFIETYIEIYKNGLTEFYGNPYALLPVLLFCILVSYHDTITMKIPDAITKSFFILRFGLIYWIPITSGNIIGFLFGALIILIPAMIINKPMGGDIKFMAVLGAYTNDAIVISSLLFGIIFFVGFAIITRMKKNEMLAFGPFISLGFGTISILYTLLS